jgi:hypothetical protein
VFDAFDRKSLNVSWKSREGKKGCCLEAQPWAKQNSHDETRNCAKAPIRIREPLSHLEVTFMQDRKCAILKRRTIGKSYDTLWESDDPRGGETGIVCAKAGEEK